jgi:hypothetical protein
LANKEPVVEAVVADGLVAVATSGPAANQSFGCGETGGRGQAEGAVGEFLSS